MNRRAFSLILVIVSSFVLITGSTPTLTTASPHTTLFTNFASFQAATGPLTTLDFEMLPTQGSSQPLVFEEYLPNPMTLNGVTFTDPNVLRSVLCMPPTCQIDPNNPLNGNIVLILNQNGGIDFPIGTGGAMLLLEGMGDVPFTLQIQDFTGSSITVTGQTELNQVTYLGFTSEQGLQHVQVDSVGPTPDCPQSPCGPLVISALYVELDDPGVMEGVWTDPASDVTPANADLTSGSAAVSGNLVDLRIRYLDSPFLNGDRHRITWCFDTDQDAATGTACGLSGADQEFTLQGEPDSLFGGTFSIEGLPASLDPCDVGSFNWDTHTLRLLLPLDVLSDHNTFNYAVKSTFTFRDEHNSTQTITDTAPGSIDFGSTSGFFTSVRAEFAPFNGTPLCSANREATIIVPAQATGTIRYFPELGILGPAPVGTMIQSTYFKTTEANREFHRGFFELTLPILSDTLKLSRATLILTESRARVYDPRPPVTHEVAYYSAADLAVTTDDYNRPATTVTPALETDENLPTQVFPIDVTDLISSTQGMTLGFRIKLAVDPTFSNYSSFGSGFGEMSTVPPRILIKVTDEETILGPLTPGSLTYSGPSGQSTSIFVPAGAVTATTRLMYTTITTTVQPVLMRSQPVVASDSSNLVSVDHRFVLDAYQSGVRRSGSIFQKPITVTLHYLDVDVTELDEETLLLNFWNGSQWEYGACGQYDRHPTENWLAVPICQVGEFAVFGAKPGFQVYLPTIQNH